MKNQPTELISTRIGNAYSDTLIDIRNLKEEILSLTDLIADAVVNKMNPAKDKISQRQAMDEFNVPLSWLDEQVAKGLLSRRRKGKCKNSPIMYKRHEIRSLIETEQRLDIKVPQRRKKNKA